VTERQFSQVIMPKLSDLYLAARLNYFSDCNLLDEVPKLNGFFSLYPRECGRMNQVLYASTNTFLPGLMDFLGVSHATGSKDLRNGKKGLHFDPWRRRVRSRFFSMTRMHCGRS